MLKLPLDLCHCHTNRVIGGSLGKQSSSLCWNDLLRPIRVCTGQNLLFFYTCWRFYHDQQFNFFLVCGRFCFLEWYFIKFGSEFPKWKIIFTMSSIILVLNPDHASESRALYQWATTPTAVGGHEWYWVVDWQAACCPISWSPLPLPLQHSVSAEIGQQAACQSTTQYHSWPPTAVGVVAHW